MAGREPLPAGRCKSCGKVRWQSRHDAKVVLRRLSNVEAGALRVYSCPTDSGFYHLGRLRTETRDEADAIWVSKMRSKP